MKILVLLASSLIILLSGCSPKTAIDSSRHDTNSTTSKTKSVEKSHNLKLVSRPEGIMDVFPAMDGIYFSGAENAFALSYWDEKTGVSTALCSRLECKHNDETCNAHFESSLYSIFMNPEKTKVFVKHTVDYLGDEVWPDQSIIMLDLNGENRKEVFKTNSAEMKRDFVFSENEMFFVTYNVNEQAQEEYNLVRLNYTTQETSIINTFPQATKIVGAYDNYLLLDLGNDSLLSADSNIVKFDIDTKETENVFHYTTNSYESNSVAFANNEQLYIIKPNGVETAELSVLDMKTNETNVLNSSINYYGPHLTYYNAPMFTSEYMILKLSTPDDKERLGARKSIYAIKLSDGTATEIKLRDQYNDPYAFLYETNNNFIVYKGSKDTTILTANKDGTSSQMSIMMSLFGVFDKNDYLNSVNKSVELR